ncbi:MAG: MFS transporter [Anaerolineales bacterium]|nr:MFS transporter [Anaerolineales bacterium]
MSAQTEPVSQHKEFGALDALKIPDFRNLWLGQLISNLGDSMTTLAVMLLINELTGSTSALAIALILTTIPQITFGLAAGVYVDRLNRKRIMIVSDLLRGLLVLGFILVDSADKVWVLYAITFLQASVGTFFLPARSAIIPNIVPKEGLLAANSISQTTRVIMTVIGTGVAGFLVGLHEYWVVFTIDAVTFFISMLLIVLIHYQQPARDTSEKVTPRMVIQQLGIGLKVTFGNRILAGAIIAISITMLGLGMVNVLLVPLLVNDLNVPETWFAAVEFAQTAAMILSGALVAGLASRFKPTYMLSGALFGLGVGVGLLAAPTNVWHVMAILFVIGFFVSPANAAIQTIIQIAVPDEVRGRSSAVNGALVSTASILAMAVAGILADAIGTRTVFIVGGVFVSLSGVVAGIIFRGVAAPEAPLPSPENV